MGISVVLLSATNDMGYFPNAASALDAKLVFSEGAVYAHLALLKDGI